MSNLALTRGATLAGFADSIAHAFGDFRAAQTKRAALRRTRKELGALTDRELNDLGLSRYEIDRVAYESVYGPLA